MKERKLPAQNIWSNLFISNWFYLWCFPIAFKALKTPFNKLNFRLRLNESSKFNGDKLQRSWAEQMKSKPQNPSILKALTEAYGVEYLMVGFYKLGWGSFTWLCAYYFLQQILFFVQNAEISSPNYGVGHLYALALLLSAFFSSIFIHQLYGECNRIGIAIKSALNVLIYRKLLKLSRVKGGAGEVVNLMATDVSRVVDAVVNFHFLWSAFLEAAVIVALAFIVIGISAVPVLILVLVLTPVQIYLGKITANINREQTELTTERVHIMSEILTAIKLIKFYAWEMPFFEKITEMRKKEMDRIKKGMLIKSINFTVVFAAPLIATLACLTMFVELGNKLTAATSFTILSIFNTLRYPFFMLPSAVRATAGALTSFARLNHYFKLEEVEEMVVEKNESDMAFEINNADFRWDGSDSEKPTLKNISIQAKKGQKIAVIGDVGSGKSSLIAAILGQIRQIGGKRIKIFGSSSYVPQQAWLLNETLRENILFGLPYDPKLYKQVIHASSLTRDLTLLIAGDKTELAERGANLSGGQRQRTSLARAIYSDADIVLLDDPISAVDQHVGRHIFDECFMKFLKDKTVLIALHQLQYLSRMDWIVIMKNGRIFAQGTYQKLMETTPEFADIINCHVDSGEQGEDDEIEEEEETGDIVDQTYRSSVSVPTHRYSSQIQVVSSSRRHTLSDDAVKLMIEKDQLHIEGEGCHDIASIITKNEHSVYSCKDIKDVKEDHHNSNLGKLVQDDNSTSSGYEDLVTYLKIATGATLTLLVFSVFFFTHGIRIGSDYWLRLWVPRIGGYSNIVYLGVYAVFAVLFLIGVLVRGILFSRIAASKAIILHDNLFKAVIRAPMSFFDKTPLGRILSAFSKHLLHVDDQTPDALLQMLQYMPLGLGALVLAAVLIPWNWAPTIGLVIIAGVFVRFSSPVIEKTKSLEAITKPPIFAHITTSLEGLFSIRAYHAQSRFDYQNLQKLDNNHQALLALLSVKSFQALWIDIFSSFIVYFSAFLIIVFCETPQMSSIAGLALSNSLQMLVFVQWTIRMWGDVNAQLSSVGQLTYYANTPSEAPAEIKETKPPNEWPQNGKIEFKDITLRYHEFGVDVLKDINLSINPTEKIGIVGRTGSGKSTLLVSLLRIVESHRGTIHIDGVDVTKIGLTDLRSRIAIIPQEPVLFYGTVRSNLDPFGKRTDDELWKALKAANLGQTISEMNGKLDSVVIENGSNFSLGQRQCFCIARAILAKTKILVLDEATAAIDMATDLLIQNTIKEAFADVTVLTIAHRLNTIIDSDRVLFMDAGSVKEFDHPHILLQNPNGHFRSLVDQTGEATSRKLTEIAKSSYLSRHPPRPIE